MLTDATFVDVPASIAVLEFRTFEDNGADEEEAEICTRLEEEQIVNTARMVAEARERTRIECTDEFQRALEQREEDLRTKIAKAIETFAQEKRKYFENVEQQIVRLSLGIAEKVLQRESAVDPLLLSGAVRVALESVSGRSSAVLKVPAGSEAAWRTHLQGVFDELTLLGDESLHDGDCVLETKVGHADLGYRAQLAEIEQSLADLPGRAGVGV